VNKEFAIFEVEGKCEANLDFITKILIQYYVVEWNQIVFFLDVDCGRTVTKIRSLLNDDNDSDGTGC
jgi:hypothetical protein